jgi:CRISPR/Cas system-associated protein Cas5 (RAMP superfamily)
MKKHLNILVSYKDSIRQRNTFKVEVKVKEKVKVKVKEKVKIITNIRNKLYRPNKKSYNPNNYKNILRKKKQNKKFDKIHPTYVNGIRLKYEKNGKISNSTKKYFNILGIPRVISKGCSSCGKSIDPL